MFAYRIYYCLFSEELGLSFFDNALVGGESRTDAEKNLRKIFDEANGNDKSLCLQIGEIVPVALLLSKPATA